MDRAYTLTQSPKPRWKLPVAVQWTDSLRAAPDLFAQSLRCPTRQSTRLDISALLQIFGQRRNSISYRLPVRGRQACRNVTSPRRRTDAMAQLVGSSPFFVPGPPAEIGHPSTSVAQFLLKNARGRVLDVGGGNGAYSLELKKHGFSVTLAEVNPDALATASAAGLDVIDMNRTHWSELKGQFDTVILVEVLEHIPDYSEFLSQAFSCASSRLLITVPCNDDFHSLFAVNLTYNHIAVSDHVNHFSSADLRKLFDDLPCSYTLERGDPLFPWAFLALMREQFRRKPLLYSLVFPLRVLNKLHLIPRSHPTRCFVVADRTPLSAPSPDTRQSGPAA